jgi:hypothetical protein
MKPEKLSWFLEKYINSVNKTQLEDYYGVGTTIKVKNVSESLKDKILLFEVSIIFGDIIEEDVLDPTLADFFISEGINDLKLLNKGYKIKTLITWDS